ncbi:hypothetical protein [Lacinutrix himadriensis]|uniref:hypothetical protein n=1 Tax=Lacinutrix himadriensis TaxID=641549 RepID=UPI0006E271B1|nr:hypothetical protein [Lacinutrix himadriensis]
MKKLLSLFFILIYISTSAQINESLTYQVVIRSASDILLTNQTVGMQISILSNSPTGSPVYIEIQTAMTNANGLATIQVGNGALSTGDFTTINWASATYYIKTETDPNGGSNYTLETVEEITSAPLAFYSNVAQFANTADYLSLSNLPTTISQNQIDKLDLITLSSAVDLDQLISDVNANTASQAFPDFGTTPGTVLEGDNFIWSKSNNDIFYTQGNVGIGVNQTTPFEGATLSVGGGIKYSGIPTTLTEPGLLYYDNTDGDGKFHFVNNEGSNVTLGASTWSTVDGDNTTSNDVIIQGSLGIGVDAVNGEDFGFNTFILKENNLRILFDDSDDPSGTMPANDWQIEINESSNGGESHFAIKDITNATQPFKVAANAPDNALIITSNGNIGIGTGTPGSSLEVTGAIKAQSFIGDGSGLTGITGGTGGVSNIDDTVIAADTDVNNVGEISFQTQNIAQMTITNNGNVGIGTATPIEKLEVIGNAKFDGVQTNNISIQTASYTIVENTDNLSAIIEIDASNKTVININNTIAQSIQGFTAGITGQQITIFNNGTGLKTIVHNSGTQSILLPNTTNIDLEQYESATFIFDGSVWYCIALNN